MLRGVGKPLQVEQLRQPHGCAYTLWLVERWKQKAAKAKVAYKRYVRKLAAKRAFDALYEKWRCIHEHEGAWNANTGNGYYGGLQMDIGFQSTYGSEFMRRWGTADRWPVWAQLRAAERAYWGYRGYGPRYFGPWPNTSRMCGVG